jgi:hypothetical protein
MVIDPGLSTEEKVFVGSRSSGSLSSVTRGVDGTLSASHDAGATCYPVFTAVDADQANKLASTMTTKGDLVSTDGSDPARLGVGTNNHRLVAASGETTGLKWVADTQNTVADAKGDLLVGTAADTIARLAVGTNDHRLVAASGETTGLKYVADTQNTVIDAKGDLLVGSAADTVARLAVGATNGQALVVDSGATNGVKWAETGGLEYISSTSFSAASSVNVDSVFSSTFSSYRITLQVYGSTNSNTRLRYRVSGGDSDTAVYYSRGYYQNATTLQNLIDDAATSAFLTNHATNSTAGLGRVSIDVHAPYLAERTIMHVQWMDSDTALCGTHHVMHANSTSYTGFTLLPSAGTITGVVRVYGYRKV